MTTFRIGGNAKFFAEVNSVEDLKAAVGYAHARNLPVFVLGGGSNILVSDQGFLGLVVHPVIKGIECKVLDSGKATCTAHAGDSWDEVVKTSVDHGLWGLETLSLIPGSVGGAVVQNIGAYGAELKDTLESVEAFDMRTGTIQKFTKEECDFAYRSSIFKQSVGRHYIVVSVTLNLSHTEKRNISYKDLATYFSEKKKHEPSLQDIRNAVIDIRTKKLPDLTKYGTAGSFFKNPIISHRHYNELHHSYKDIVAFPQHDGTVKLSAAWIIDHVCKLKGYREGDAGVYDTQALVIVNHGKASAADINAIAHKIEKAVHDATDIKLEREVEGVGV